MKLISSLCKTRSRNIGVKTHVGSDHREMINHVANQVVIPRHRFQDQERNEVIDLVTKAVEVPQIIQLQTSDMMQKTVEVAQVIPLSKNEYDVACGPCTWHLHKKEARRQFHGASQEGVRA